METLTLEGVPKVVLEMSERIKNLETLILQKSQPENDIEQPTDIEGASIITGKSIATLYGLCQKKQIPYSKRGKRLYFFKSELIEWIKEGRRKTVAEVQEEAENISLK